jgi:hypothetical protein
MIAAANTHNCILESSGLSWRLHNFILCHPTIIRRGIKDIILFGHNQDFLDRIQLRRQTTEAIPFIYTNLTEEGLVKRASLEALSAKYPTGYCLQVSERDEEEIYEEFKTTILKYKQEIGSSTRQ